MLSDNFDNTNNPELIELVKIFSENNKQVTRDINLRQGYVNFPA